MNGPESDAPKNWLRWTSALVAVAVLLFMGSRLLSYFVEREVTSAIEEIRDGMKKSPPQTHAAPRGSRLVWQGDSVGAVLAIVRSPASRNSDTLVLIGTLDSTMASVRDLSGFVSVPISETQAVVVNLLATTDTAGLHGVATLWPGQFPRPIRVFKLAPEIRSPDLSH